MISRLDVSYGCCPVGYRLDPTSGPLLINRRRWTKPAKRITIVEWRGPFVDYLACNRLDLLLLVELNNAQINDTLTIIEDCQGRGASS